MFSPLFEALLKLKARTVIGPFGKGAGLRTQAVREGGANTNTKPTEERWDFFLEEFNFKSIKTSW